MITSSATNAVNDAHSRSGTVDHWNVVNATTKTLTRATEWTPRTTNPEKLTAPLAHRTHIHRKNDRRPTYRITMNDRLVN